MIIVRPTETFKMVCMSDPALDEVSGQTMVEYGVSRDINVLPLDKLTRQPTVFTCRPLRPEYEHLAEGEMGPFERWGIFSTHVTKVDPAPAEIRYIERQGEKVIDPDVRDMLPPNIVREVAETVVQWASSDGDAVPFSPPDTSWQTARVRRAMLRAGRAHTTETASDADSK